MSDRGLNILAIIAFAISMVTGVFVICTLCVNDTERTNTTYKSSYLEGGGCLLPVDPNDCEMKGDFKEVSGECFSSEYCQQKYIHDHTGQSLISSSEPIPKIEWNTPTAVDPNKVVMMSDGSWKKIDDIIDTNVLSIGYQKTNLTISEPDKYDTITFMNGNTKSLTINKDIVGAPIGSLWRVSPDRILEKVTTEGKQE